MADWKATSLPAKPIVAIGGGIGAVAGTLASVPKTGGVAAFEYFDHSFGESRGRGFFDYITRSPLVHTIAMGSVAALLGVALHAVGIAVRPDWGIATTFGAGVATHLSSRLFLALPEVFTAKTTGSIGRGLTRGREFVEWFKKPLGDYVPAEKAQEAKRQG